MAFRPRSFAATFSHVAPFPSCHPRAKRRISMGTIFKNVLLEDDTGGESKASFSCYKVVVAFCECPRATAGRPYIKRTEKLKILCPFFTNAYVFVDMLRSAQLDIFRSRLRTSIRYNLPYGRFRYDIRLLFSCLLCKQHIESTRTYRARSAYRSPQANIDAQCPQGHCAEFYQSA